MFFVLPTVYFFNNILNRNCPHCVALTPIIEEMAKDYSQDPSVMIAQFNTHANDLPNGVEIKYVPTLILFKNCQQKMEQVTFHGQNRTFTELTNFINTNKC